jgi:hypothetical protein
MAFEHVILSKTYLVASAVNFGQPVALLGQVTPGSARDEAIHPAASLNIHVLGVARATCATPGLPVEVALDGFVKVVACGSLGAGAIVGVGSTNGRLIPQVPSAAATAMAVRWIVGTAETAAADAGIFTVRLKPDQIV